MRPRENWIFSKKIEHQHEDGSHVLQPPLDPADLGPLNCVWVIYLDIDSSLCSPMGIRRCLTFSSPPPFYLNHHLMRQVRLKENDWSKVAQQASQGKVEIRTWAWHILVQNSSHYNYTGSQISGHWRAGWEARDEASDLDHGERDLNPTSGMKLTWE